MVNYNFVDKDSQLIKLNDVYTYFLDYIKKSEKLKCNVSENDLEYIFDNIVIDIGLASTQTGSFDMKVFNDIFSNEEDIINMLKKIYEKPGFIEVLRFKDICRDIFYNTFKFESWC